MKPEEYGEKYPDHLIEQYKSYVEMADNISNRRSQMNSFYVTLLSGLLAVISIIIDNNITCDMLEIAILSLSILGIILCSIWLLNIESYRSLNSGKYKIIQEMELLLPFPCYDREWEIMGLKGKGVKRQHIRLTQIEKFVPILISLPYILILIYSVFSIIK